VAARLEKGDQPGQQPLVLRQVLDDAHHHDRVVFPVGLIFQDVGEDQLPVIASGSGHRLEVLDGGARDRKPRALHPKLGGILEPGAPARTDFQDVVARFQPALLKTVGELAQAGVGERLVVVLVEALRVERHVRVEELQEE
jgi:hypothetical protein